MEATTTIIDSPALGQFSHEDIVMLWNDMTLEEQAEFDAILRMSAPRALMPHQMVPLHQTWWEVYLLVGGRGVGKTVAGAFEARNHLNMFKNKARIGVMAPTNADARDTCMEGETGLIAMFPHEFIYYNRSIGEARHIHGGYVKAVGSEEPKRWNGPQWSMLWGDELALCNQNSWDQGMFGLRLGERPYAVATTTPKNRKWIKNLAMEPTTYVPQYIDFDENGNVKHRLPTTFDNHFLPQRRVDWLKRKYGGSRLGRQELDGMFIDDIEGAMWKRDWIRHVTDPSEWPRILRMVIAIDPAGSSSRREADENALTEEQKQNQQKNADTAIAAIGVGENGRMYVFAIIAGQWTPDEWATQAIRLFYKYNADKIIAEINYGGEMVENTLRGIHKYDEVLGRKINGRYLPIEVVTASKGKAIRAQPVAVLYEQGRVIHCAMFAAAEDQMCAFVDTKENEGADMVDAVVWGISKLAEMDVQLSGKAIVATNRDPRLTKTQTSIILPSSHNGIIHRPNRGFIDPFGRRPHANGGFIN